MPRMPAVAWGFGHVGMATLGHARSLLSCAGSHWVVPGCTGSTPICASLHQSTLDLWQVTVGCAGSTPSHASPCWIHVRSQQVALGLHLVVHWNMRKYASSTRVNLCVMDTNGLSPEIGQGS